MCVQLMQIFSIKCEDEDEERNNVVVVCAAACGILCYPLLSSRWKSCSACCGPHACRPSCWPGLHTLTVGVLSFHVCHPHADCAVAQEVSVAAAGWVLQCLALVSVDPC